MLSEVRDLSPAYINQLKPSPPNADGKCYDRSVRDTLRRGLYLVVQPSGKKSWVVRYRHAGRSRKYTIGEWDVIKIAAAREKAREILAAVSDGRDPAAEKQEQKKVRASNTFPAVVMDFIERH